MSLDSFPSHLFDNAVIVERTEASVVTIMINRPKAMNTMDSGVIGGVLQALEMCADDPSVVSLSRIAVHRNSAHQHTNALHTTTPTAY